MHGLGSPTKHGHEWEDANIHDMSQSSNMRSEQRRHSVVIDLTQDGEVSDDDESMPLPVSSQPANAPSAMRSFTPFVPLPGMPQYPSCPTNIETDRRLSHGSRPSSSSSRPSSAADMGRSGANTHNHGPVPVSRPGHGHISTGDTSYSERAAKRMKVYEPERPIPPASAPQSVPNPAWRGRPVNGQLWNGGKAGGIDAMSAPPDYSAISHSQPAHAVSNSHFAYKPPSVQDMNRALKTSAVPIPALKDVPPSVPRPLHIGRISSNGGSSSDVNTDRGAPQTIADVQRQQEPSALQKERHELAARKAPEPKSVAARPVLSTQAQKQPPLVPSATTRSEEPRPQDTPPALLTSRPLSRPSYFAGPVAEPPDEDKDSVMSDVSPPPNVARPVATSVAPTVLNSPLSTNRSIASKSTTAPKRKTTNQFDQEQDDYLIFLKEVKGFTWKQITAEYNTDMPHREYHSLQSRYSTVLNKRDRTQDSKVLTLPSRWATEATVDWQGIHANNTIPTWRNQFNTPREKATPVRQPQQQALFQDTGYSSGTDSAPMRERPRRAQRVNYTWPKQRRGVIEDQLGEEELVEDMSMFDQDLVVRSETPTEADVPLPDTAVAVENEPMELNFDTDNARLGLDLSKRSRGNLTKVIPYLSSSQRFSIQNPTAGTDWDQLSSRNWQGSMVHVDFSPPELKAVERLVSTLKGSALRTRHGTKRKQFRDLLQGLPEPKILQLAFELRQHLPCRDTSSITAFLRDAVAGTIAETPQVHRLAAARPDDRMHSTQKKSVSSIMRERELSHRSRRGWQAASKPLTYQIKNKFMDTLGPAACWTGASSDIHIIAWSPDGEHFAVGAVAVDDPDSMQYNRPNNLLFGDVTHGTIHELGEHYVGREKTQTGANSSHAMFVSQDPKLYSTVSSVAFSTSGRYMYSTGYDRSIGIWHTDTESEQPILVAKLKEKHQVDILAVDRTHTGILATAAKVSNEKAIRVLMIDEENPSHFEKLSFHSSKAVSRTDLKILPTALQFEPRYGGLLLAGFGANMRESGFDMTGDLCLWDVETQSRLNIYGSSKNVFDIEFNPNRSSMPLFAVGCVAGSNVNKGTRSLIRCYDPNGPDKFTCITEIECKALDMNDVVWCPHDEHMIAAGCTDGRAYVWDLRWGADPLRVLSHGRSLMPLQEGVKHEETDTGVRFLSWGENATRLYSGSSDGVVKVWDVTRAEENTFIKDLITTDSGIMSGAFSADYSKLVVGEVNGSVNVLEVGRDDFSIKEADKLRYVPYQDDDSDEAMTDGTPRAAPESGIAEGNHLLQTRQLQLAPMGSLPIHQAVQGPQYAGPFDQSIDAPFLREQALEFQLSMAAPSGPQCDIPACKDSLNKVTSEEVGDSGRSTDRIPDELRRQWKALDAKGTIVPGKSKCTHCGRPARPSFDTTDPNTAVLCERCSFACFRCGATTFVPAATTTLICDYCAGEWEIGALGYQCIQQPTSRGMYLDVPVLKKWSKETYLEKLEALDTSFGDEMNALTDYYFGLAIDRPESPPL